MRAPGLAAIVLALLVVAAGVPADAKPRPGHHAMKLVRHALAETEEGAATLLTDARALLPRLPARNGDLEVRAVLTQPAVRGEDETMAIVWLAAREGAAWKGAVWADGATGSVAPSYLELDEVGVLLSLEGTALARDGLVDATYHFLGVDGKHRALALGPIPVLDTMPVLPRVDVGGAIAVEREDLPAILVTPWNLLERNVTMGLTLRAGDVALDTLTAPACADLDATHTEPGCRHLYVLPLDDTLTHVDLWRMEDGARVVDRTLERAELLAGVTFTP